MGFDINVSIPVFTVFLQGFLSFFSPCVLPLIPLYIGYLSGGMNTIGNDGKVEYKRSKVMVNTLFFVIGISFTFFLLGFGVSALGSFFKSNQLMFARVGGILVILFGLYQLGIFGQSKMLGKEHRLPFQPDVISMSPIIALLMGFTFSFAWTPCVGPALTSVLLMAASASTKWAGMALIGVYTLGFVLPFLAVGLFTTSLLELFKKHGKVVKYTVKVGGVLMILMGFMMFSGKMNSITGYLSKLSVNNSETENEGESNKSEKRREQKKENNHNSQDEKGNDTDEEKTGEEKQNKGEQEELQEAIDFTLTDQYGDRHTLSEYKGKTVFINFWATWCPPCRAEMPDIQKIFEESKERDDLVILGVAAPNNGQEGTEEEIKKFLNENGYSYPVLMDRKGEVFTQYGVYSYPTTFMITKEGKVFGYASGQMNESMMRSIIKQTIEGKRSQ